MSSSLDECHISVVEVKRVQFGILSPNEIRRMSVANIEFSEVYEAGEPKLGGLMDPRQGYVDKRCRCQSCDGSRKSCPGHFGHLELTKPVFHVGFLPKAVKILGCVCFYCSKLLVNKDCPKVKDILGKTKTHPHKRMSYIHSLCKCRDVCERRDDIPKESGRGGCGRSQPVIHRQGLDLTAEWKGTNDGEDKQARKIVITAEKVLEIFKGISNDECIVMGLDPRFARPDWMIAQVIPVPPLSVRPTVRKRGCARIQDDLTHKLADIVKINNRLRRNEQNGASVRVIEDDVKLLQFHVATLTDNELPKLPRATAKGGRLLKSMTQRLNGQKGRIRYNLMGKRVDFSARTVITPDPNLQIDQIGIPRTIAQKLTFPEIVTPFNIVKLQGLVNRGDKQYPGVRCVVRKDGTRIDLKSGHSSSIELQLAVDDMVERHMVDDDIVTMNFQPTLHRTSMMGHRVKVLPWSTFRVNLSVTTPYKADFEGGQMALHFPQSQESRAEISELAMVPRQILSPQSSRPIFGIVQDALIGSFKMTKRDSFIEKYQMMDLLMQLPSWDGKMPQPAILKPKPLWTGKQLFSLIIPGDTVNMTRTHSTHPDNEDSGPYKWISPGDTKVLIERGELISGILCSKTLGTCAGSLPHIVHLELGHEACARFYNEIQSVVNNWLLIEGQSFGIVDTIADQQTYVDGQRTIRNAKRNVIDIIEKALGGELERSPCSSLKDTFENRINGILKCSTQELGGPALQSLSRFNQFKAMVEAGSGVSKSYLTQVILCVGQQSVDGKRIPMGFRHRSLPHFIKHDHGPQSGGFVENGLLAGVTPSEFFFQCMASRDQYLKAYIKATDSSIVLRRLIKAMESLMIGYNRTVRTAAGHVVEFRYGEDGLAGEFIEMEDLPTIKPSNRMFEERFRMDLNDEKYLQRVYAEDIARSLISSVNMATKLAEEWRQLEEDRKLLRQIFPRGSRKVPLPFNLQRMIWNAQKKFRINPRGQSQLHPLHVLKGVNEICEKLVVLKGQDLISQLSHSSPTFLLCSLIRSTLCTKRMADEHKLTAEAFDWLLAEMETRFNRAIVQPGEMVGPLAAQSIVEAIREIPQHSFDVENKNVTVGVPRLKEIISVSKTPKTPVMTVFLTGQAAADEEKAKAVIGRLEHTTLRHVTANTAIYYDPDPRHTVIPEDQDWVNGFCEKPDFDLSQASDWMLRIELDRTKMNDKKLTMHNVTEAIRFGFGNECLCISTDDNAPKLVVRIRMMASAGTGDKQDDPVHKVQDDLLLRCIEATMMSPSATLRGIPEVRRMRLTKSHTGDKMRNTITDEGELCAKAEWLLETDGTALLGVLSDPAVDGVRTYSNHISEVFKVLGIEACRNAIERELRGVISSEGSYVNCRHLAVLCDVMTCKGRIMPISPRGLSCHDVGCLMKSSFEHTAEVLTDAAVHAEVDHVRGVSEKIILGQLARIGTGCFDLRPVGVKC